MSSFLIFAISANILSGLLNFWLAGRFMRSITKIAMGAIDAHRRVAYKAGVRDGRAEILGYAEYEEAP